MHLSTPAIFSESIITLYKLCSTSKAYHQSATEEVQYNRGTSLSFGKGELLKDAFEVLITAADKHLKHKVPLSKLDRFPTSIEAICLEVCGRFSGKRLALMTFVVLFL